MNRVHGILVGIVGLLALGFGIVAQQGGGIQGGGGCSPAGNADEVLLDDGSGGCGSVSGLGTSGQVLTSNGAGMAPTWEDSGGFTTGTFTATYSDACTTSPTQQWQWVKVGPQVTLYANGANISCTSDSGNFNSGFDIPTAIRPQDTVRFPLVSVTNNGVNEVACISFGSTGVISILRLDTQLVASLPCVSTQGWTASGNKAVRFITSIRSFTYLRAN